MISPVSTCNQVVMIPSVGTCNQGVTTPPVSACNQAVMIPPVSTCNHVWILNEYVALASINIGEARSWWSWRISNKHPLFGHPTKILVIITNWLTVTKYQYFSNGNRSFTFYLFFFSLSVLYHRLVSYQTLLWGVRLVLYRNHELLTLLDHLKSVPIPLFVMGGGGGGYVF